MLLCLAGLALLVLQATQVVSIAVPWVALAGGFVLLGVVYLWCSSRPVGDDEERGTPTPEKGVFGSGLLSHASHELRTPLTAIIGYAELLAEGCPGSCAFGKEEARSHLATLARSAEHLLCIVDDILDYSKVEAGELKIERIVCSPAELAKEATELLRVRAQAANVALELELCEPLPALFVTDPTRCLQILMNLLTNALKFTPHGRVRLVVRRAGDSHVQFDVIDTGIGIAPEQVGTLFRPFAQAERSTTRRFGGTGLGLAISQRLARLLGGDITVESQPRVGSCFCVTIASGSPEEAARASTIAGVGVRSSARPPRTTDVPLTLSGRVLLAEDGLDNQRLIGFLLCKAGLDVAVAEDGRSACDQALAARAADRPFDVILMDMQMPIMSGFEATAHLRAAGYAGPIVALTAHAMAGDRERCLAAGCDDYVAKPVRRATLLAAVGRQLERVDQAQCAIAAT
jgi:CheY-like chemotaxis protein